MSKAINLKLEWEQHDEATLRGYQDGYPDTTLFLISRVNRHGDVRLMGSFVPDAVRESVWDIEHAKVAADKYMCDWIEMVTKQMELIDRSRTTQ